MEKRGKQLLFLVILLLHARAIVGQDYQKALEKCLRERNSMVLEMNERNKIAQSNYQIKIDKALRTYADGITSEVETYTQQVIQVLGKIYNDVPDETILEHNTKLPSDLKIKLNRHETNFWSEIEKKEIIPINNDLLLSQLDKLDTQLIRLFWSVQKSNAPVPVKQSKKKAPLFVKCVSVLFLYGATFYLLSRGLDLVAMQYKIKWYSSLKKYCITFKNEQIRKRLIALAQRI